MSSNYQKCFTFRWNIKQSGEKKPFMNDANRQKRLEFAKMYLNKPIEFWKNVIFSDESKFNIFYSDGRKYV